MHPWNGFFLHLNFTDFLNPVCLEAEWQCDFLLFHLALRGSAQDNAICSHLTMTRSSSLHLIFLSYFIKTSLLFLVPIHFLLLFVLSHCSDHLAYWEQKGRPCHRAAASPDWGCEKLIPPNWHHAVLTAPVNFCLFSYFMSERYKSRRAFAGFGSELEIEPGFFICHCGCEVFTLGICHMDRGF